MARAPRDAAGGVQGDGRGGSAGTAVGRGSSQGWSLLAHRTIPVVVAKRRIFPTCHRLLLCRNPGGKLQTASLTLWVTPSAKPCQHAQRVGWGPRDAGGDPSPHLFICSKKQAGAAEQPARLRWVMEWLLGCCRVERSIDKTVFTRSFAELLSWCRTWSCMGMSQPRPLRFAEAGAEEQRRGGRIRPGWGSPLARGESGAGRDPGSLRRCCCCQASPAFPSNSSGSFLKLYL